MHTIVDEIYALSATEDFQSVLRVLDGKLGDDVHLVWSLSKDFGASGLRVGFVLSGNQGTAFCGHANCNFCDYPNPSNFHLSMTKITCMGCQT